VYPDLVGETIAPGGAAHLLRFLKEVHRGRAGAGTGWPEAKTKKKLDIIIILYCYTVILLY